MNFASEPVFIQLLSLYDQEVNNNSDIEVEIINTSSGDIMLGDDGVININRAGLYFIGWWTNIEDDNVVVSLLRDEDNEVITSCNAPSKANNIKGNSIVEFKAGEKVKFVNDSGTKKELNPIISGVSMNVCIYLIKEGE